MASKRKIFVLVILLVFSVGGFSIAQSQKNDTILSVRLPEVEFKDIRKWENDTLRYRFNQTRYYVQTILPYLETATKLFHELKEQSYLNRRQKRHFVKSLERDLTRRFEDEIKALNETQGLLLMKLIARQTGENVYVLLHDYKNPFYALKWQAWARLNGFDLNRKYRPDHELLLEQVMASLGYPLPDFYRQ